MNGKERYLFHIHTWRCGHAENVTDEEYIKTGIALHASDIWFTDHAPFPDSEFRGRMRMEQLDEYIWTLSDLRYEYRHDIAVHIGLEIEYLSSYEEYIRELYLCPEIECLLLGQHMFELENGKYSFMDRTLSKRDMTSGFIRTAIQGIQTGMFPIVAHPDRLFKYEKVWDSELSQLSEALISAAAGEHSMLEYNATLAKKKRIRTEFWKNVDSRADIVYGLDAHSISDLEMIKMIDDSSFFENRKGIR